MKTIPEIVNEAIRERVPTNDPLKFALLNETVYNVACEAVKIAFSECAESLRAKTSKVEL